MGRTLDGGYYLIGMRGFHDVLPGVPMSTVTAAEALAARAEGLGLRLAELPVTFDIDEERRSGASAARAGPRWRVRPRDLGGAAAVGTGRFGE